MQILDEVIFDRELANGLHVVIRDNSKRIAADRWFVKLNCLCEMEIDPASLARLTMGAEELAAFSKEQGGKARHQFIKERNFVDEGEREEVVAELLAQIEDTTLAYLATSGFATNLLQQNVDDFCQEYRVRQEMGLNRDSGEDDDDGPADFSACFEDD